MSPAIWFLIGLSAIAGWAGFVYNRFVALRQRRENAYSDVDVQLKRRWDLVPALVETVRGYAGHEHAVLTEVTAARGRAMDAGGTVAASGERGEREAGLAAALRGVFVLAEEYPALRADRNFLELHRALVTIEDGLQHARRYYNAVVRDLNTLRGSFPAGLVGGATGFAPAEYFQLEADERAVPTVELGTSASVEGE